MIHQVTFLQWIQQPAGLEHLHFLSSLSLHLHSFASCFSPSSSLGLEEFIPMAASAASNALTSASDLRTTLVIRQDSYLSGSPTASVPLSFYPSYFYHILFLLSLSIISLLFSSCSPAVCSICLFFFCLIITSELYDISFVTFHDGPVL